MSGSGPVLSPLDRGRFGVVTARWDAASDAELADALAFCREHDVELLIARCDTGDATAAHGLERAGALLMDTMIHFACDPARRPSDAAEAPPVRSATREDATQVREIAGEAFRGYVGHYHADPRLDRAAVDEVYPDWAFRSCVDGGVADEVLVCERGGRLAGFATLRIQGETWAEIPLAGVRPSERRRGIHRALTLAALGRADARGVERVEMSTQVMNHASQRSHLEAGFLPHRSEYTFHLWRS